MTLSFREDNIALITLENSARANAISPAMMVQFSEAVDALDRWSAGRAVILTGSGGTFCSGADLKSSPDLYTEFSGRAMSEVMSDATNRLRGLPLLSVAAIAGAAVGGGAELATACDYRCMTESAVIQWVHVSRGVTPGWGGLRRLCRLVGRSHALFIAGSGGALTAHQAAAFQLVDSLIPHANSDSEVIRGAVQFLQQFLRGGNEAISTAPLRALKRTLHVIDEGAAANTETEAFLELWGGPAHKEFMRSWHAGAQKPQRGSEPSSK